MLAWVWGLIDGSAGEGAAFKFTYVVVVTWPHLVSLGVWD